MAQAHRHHDLLLHGHHPAARLCRVAMGIDVVRDFTEAEKEELSDTVWNFIADRKLDGCRCVVIVNGRDADVVAFSSDDKPYATTMLANAYRSVKNYTDSKAN